MAEDNHAEMLTIPDEPGSQQTQGLDDAQDVDDIELAHFRIQGDIISWIICGFLNNLSKEDILEARREFCSCVNSIIEAYEGKLCEVKVLRNAIELLKRKTQEKNKKISQLQRTVSELTEQLASKVCEECGKKGITEQLSKISVHENKNESSKRSETEIDGRERESMDAHQTRKMPLENEEIYGNKPDSASDEESPFSFTADIRCPYAHCGLVALLCMLNRMKIYFCPTKFIQKLGADTQHKAPSCTQILNNLHELGYLKRVHKCEDINEGEHNEVLETAATALNESGQEAGLLSYSTEKYNHCVTVYTTEKKTQMRIYDADVGIEYIENLAQVRSLELIILKCDENGEPLIKKKWSEQCHTDICMNEFKQLSKPGPECNVLDEDNPGTEQL